MPFKCNQPAVPTVQQDDAVARITRWDFAPGAATGYHTHGWPYFVVMLTDAVMKIEATDGAVSEVRLSAGQLARFCQRCVRRQRADLRVNSHERRDFHTGRDRIARECPQLYACMQGSAAPLAHCPLPHRTFSYTAF